MVKSLYEYQRQGVEFLRSRGSAGLFDDPGLGKTPQACVAIPPDVPAVVVCPSAVKFNWLKELREWRPELKPYVVSGTANWKWPQVGQVMIANYDIIPPAAREIERLQARIVSIGMGQVRGNVASIQRQIERAEVIRSKLTNPYPNTCLIADEAHFLKSGNARRCTRWREIAMLCAATGGRIYLLTGTPLVNNADELWTVLQAAGLGKKAFGSHQNFTALWQGNQEGFVEKMREVSIHRLRADVLPQLPPKTREVRLVPITTEMKGWLDGLLVVLERRGMRLETATLDQIRSAVEDMQVRQHTARVRSALAKAKMPAVMEWVMECEEQGTPPVLFSCHRFPVDTLGKRKGWTVITGDESPLEKFKRAEDFQKGLYAGVALTARAGGTGINLFRAWHAGMVDLDWTPASVCQQEDRLCRIGQKAAGLLYTRFVADHPLERRVEQLLARKQADIDRGVTAAAVTGPAITTEQAAGTS